MAIKMRKTREPLHVIEVLAANKFIPVFSLHFIEQQHRCLFSCHVIHGNVIYITTNDVARKQYNNFLTLTTCVTMYCTNYLSTFLKTSSTTFRPAVRQFTSQLFDFGGARCMCSYALCWIKLW